MWWSLFLIKSQAWYLFWRTSAKDCFCIAHTPLIVNLSILLYSAPSSSSSRLLLRSNCPEVFYKKGVLRNFDKFTGKHLCQSLFFNKVAGYRPATLLKKRLLYRCFPLNFCKISKNNFFIEHLWWLLLTTFNISDVCFWFKFKKLQRN